MRQIALLYRHPDMGFSIGRVFRPIEAELSRHAIIKRVEMPCCGYSAMSLIRNILSARRVVKGCDVIHITGQEHYLIPFLDRNKLVVTVHDLGSIIDSEHGLSGCLKHLLFVKTLRLAHRITCISESTKQEIMRLCDVKEERITVIPNCVDPSISFVPSVGQTKPRILQVGSNSNKNLSRTVAALKGIDCHLRIIAPDNQELRRLMDDAGIEHSIAFRLTDKEMRQEYIDCTIVSFPSLYEGFGMPIIEGQATGRVVVTSNLSPMKEVAGNAAVLVDPTDIQSIRNGFIEAIEKRDIYIQKGLENVKRFDVLSVVDSYLQVYATIDQSCQTDPDQPLAR